MRRILVNPHRKSDENRRYKQNAGTVVRYTVDFTTAAEDRGTTVASVVWSSDYSSATFTNESLTNAVAVADIKSTTTQTEAIIKCTATYADGEDEIQYIQIGFESPYRRC